MRGAVSGVKKVVKNIVISRREIGYGEKK